jgi:hypothetical protein
MSLFLFFYYWPHFTETDSCCKFVKRAFKISFSDLLIFLGSAVTPPPPELAPPFQTLLGPLLAPQAGFSVVVPDIISTAWTFGGTGYELRTRNWAESYNDDIFLHSSTFFFYVPVHFVFSVELYISLPHFLLYSLPRAHSERWKKFLAVSDLLLSPTQSFLSCSGGIFARFGQYLQ